MYQTGSSPVCFFNLKMKCSGLHTKLKHYKSNSLKYKSKRQISCTLGDLGYLGKLG